MSDERWMRRALALAERAAALEEVPVGAALVRDGRLLGEGRNRMVAAADPTAHAEIVALRAGAALAGNYRLSGATLYVTLEPCTMCLGAMLHARVERLVFGAREPRAGMVCSRGRLLDLPHYNHRMTWEEGLLAERAAHLLREFFRRRR